MLVLKDSRKQSQLSYPQLFLTPLGDAAFEKATLLARDLRQQGIRCVLDFETRSLKSAMRLANKLQAQHVLILGDSELQTGRYPLKRMSDGTQREVLAEEIPRVLRETTSAPLQEVK
jgi:histidyl-tRNA synthetase